MVVVAEDPDAAHDLKALNPFIKEYRPVLIGVGTRRGRLREAGFPPELIVGDPDASAPRRCARSQVVLPADADGHAAGLSASKTSASGR